ncbi:ribose 5-phosphate isomerase B [Pedobacter sp. MC2016-14]|uniref:ribose 5-phosphate isomerase B n=1 Tax=Pedobacter sp. MC2016-14 TaxID=2897327 RepID=UPI001E2E808E|nr:ribose 5-phosphate isomerase B [Pedobacter sp. MC2016-14]MCD0487856.1 ribose 5-phosphate isomerase B [Pedobacter sp. MC2016-14]
MATQKQINIAIGADHAGYDYKEMLKQHLGNFEIKDFGAHSTASVDYPDFAHPVAAAVEQGEFTYGILICGSANGVAITANKHKGIRAAICWETEIAGLVRQHNDANILCIPARFVTEATAREMVDLFLNTNFEGGRHATRVGKISC